MMKIKKSISVIIALVMIITSVSLPTQVIFASESKQFAGANFAVEYVLHSSWYDGYSATIELINTGLNDIEEWFLFSNNNLGLSEWSVSGGRLFSQTDDETVIAYTEWNSVIPVGGRVSISLNGTHGGEAPVPTDYQLLSAKDESMASRQLISAGDYSVNFVTYHETAESFNNAIMIRNNTGRMIYGWEFSFEITAGAVIDVAHVAEVSQNIVYDGANVTIAQRTGSGIVWHPNMEMHVQLLGTKESDIPVAFTNFEVFERTVTIDIDVEPKPTPLPTSTPIETPQPVSIYSMQSDPNWSSISSASTHPIMRGTNSTGGASRVNGPPRELHILSRNGTSQGLRVRANALLSALPAEMNTVTIEYSGRLNVAGSSQIRIEQNPTPVWESGVNIWTSPTNSANMFTQTIKLTREQLQHATTVGTGDITLGASPANAELVITEIKISAIATSGEGDKHFLTILSGEGGRVILGDSGYYLANSEIELEVEADEDYCFFGWETSDGGEFYYTLFDPFNVFLMPDNPTTITAKFVFMCDTDSNGNGIPDWREEFILKYLPDTDINDIISWFTPNDPIIDNYNPDDYPPSLQHLSESNINPALLSNDNWLIPSISGTVNGLIDKHLWLEESWLRVFDEHRALLSPVVEVVTDYDSPLTLTFTATTSLTSYEGNLKSLFIMYWDGSELHSIDTIVNGTDGTLSATIQDAAVYFVMDLDEFLKGIGIDVFSDFSESVVPMESSMASFENDFFFEEELPYIALTDNYGNPICEISNPEYFHFIETDVSEPFSLELFTPFVVANNASIAGNNVRGRADIVFVIDTTGSMGSFVNNVRSNIGTFASRLVSEFNIDANFALVDFKDITSDGINSTRVIRNGSSNWFNDAQQFSNAIGSLRISGGGDTPETAIDGLEMARQLNFRPNASKFIILVTDATYKIDNRFGITSMVEMAGLLADDGIITSVICPVGTRSAYSVLYETTNGVYGDIRSNFSSVLLQFAGIIGETTNNGFWTMLDDYQVIRLKGSTLDDNYDTDDDGILDKDELNNSYWIDMTPHIRRIAASHGIPFDGNRWLNSQRGSVKVWSYRSNPAARDTDRDGLSDLLDTAPRNPNVASLLIYETQNHDDFDGPGGLNEQPDFQYGRQSKAELRAMEWISWIDFPIRMDWTNRWLWIANYRASWELLATATSIGDLGMHGVKRDMISHFMSGTGSAFHSDILTNRAQNHANTRTYVNEVREAFSDLVRESNGDIRHLAYNREQHGGNNTNRKNHPVVASMLCKCCQEHVIIQRPVFNNNADWTNGLGITVHDPHGNNIAIVADRIVGDYREYTLRFTLFDIFGLDSSDIEESSPIPLMDFGMLAGFRSWYILQHYDEFSGRHRPFVTYMIFEETVRVAVN